MVLTKKGKKPRDTAPERAKQIAKHACVGRLKLCVSLNLKDSGSQEHCTTGRGRRGL